MGPMGPRGLGPIKQKCSGSREQRAESREQRAESRERRAESREQSAITARWREGRRQVDIEFPMHLLIAFRCLVEAFWMSFS